jgi:biotin transport system substrate-specific component
MKRSRVVGQEHAPAERVVGAGREHAPAHHALVEVAAATAFAALTALGARVQLHLPFTPVPVTGQVFCVLLAGAVLGPRLGFLSMVEYLAAGAAGLPVFAYGGGPAALLGPTGGYLAGFPIAAAVVGSLRPARAISTPRLLNSSTLRSLAACLCGAAVIHLFGAAWYAVWSFATTGAALLPAVLAQSVLPFVGPDVVKAALAAALSPGLRRRLPQELTRGTGRA